MKWREPWRESIKQQGALPGSWRRLIRSFLIWLGVFAALVMVYALAGTISYQDIPGRLAGVSLVAAVMAVLLHLTWLLSPRKIDSGPRGIVVTKADELLLIPWQAIASFRLSRAVLPGFLLLRLHSGETYRIVLPHDAQPSEIGREITKMIGAQV
jgi:hypothetical protein